MKIKDLLKSKLSAKSIKKLKFIIMQNRFICSKIKKKYGLIKVNEKIVEEVKIISEKDKNIFFGYYDIQQFNDKENILLIHILDKKKCDTKKDEIHIAYVENDKIIKVGASKAWSWQQGSRLRWHPQKKNCIMYNDKRNEKYVNVVYDIKNKKEIEVYNMAFYDVSPDGKYGLGLNFSRLQRLRPGYGYSTIEDETEGISAPQESGIIRYNLITNEKKELISLEELAKSVDNYENYEHYINHISISPNGKKFIFFHLWTIKKSSYWNMNLYVADIETGKYELIENKKIISHYCWKSDEELLVTTAGMKGVVPEYILYNIKNNKKRVLLKNELNKDGHPNYIKNTNSFISDTYPINSIQHLFMVKKDKIYNIVDSYSDPRLYDDMRCDMHPRISKNGKYITIDTTYKNKVRSVMVLKIKGDSDE